MSIITIDREKSKMIYEASCEIFPGGVNSPVRAFPGLNQTPIVVKKANKSHLVDMDDKEYIDFCMSWGALILGHCPENVVQAVQRQLSQGWSFGTITPYELQLAEKISDHFHSIEKIRFVSSATEAVMSAIRLARGVTEKKGIIKFNGHYHGHSDSMLVQAGSGVNFINPKASSKGVLTELAQFTFSLPFNDIELCRDFIRHHDDIAAVILEPIAGNMGVCPADIQFLEMLRAETAAKGILLIFDETITGFRVGLQGAQGLYQISPDLTILGKIVGGGFPAAAFGGRKEIMDHLAPLGQVYQAGTLAGHPLAMIAGYHTLCALEAEGFYETLSQKTKDFVEPIKKEFSDRDITACLQLSGSMFSIAFGVSRVSSKEDLLHMDHDRFKKLFTFLFQRGIYIPPSPYEAWFISSSHTKEDLNKALAAILEFIDQEF